MPPNSGFDDWLTAIADDDCHRYQVTADAVVVGDAQCDHIGAGLSIGVAGIFFGPNTTVTKLPNASINRAVVG